MYSSKAAAYLLFWDSNSTQPQPLAVRTFAAALTLQVHCVRAFGHVHGALAKHGTDVPVVLHSWTGSEEMVVTFLQLPRVFFSLSGHLTKLPPNKAIPMVGGWAVGGWVADGVRACEFRRKGN